MTYYSPDGRSWWDGAHWQPLPPVYLQPMQRQSNPFVSGFVGCFGVAAAVIFSLFVIVVVFGH